MSRTICRTSDPVELLLKRILKRAVFLAGASSMAACVPEGEFTDDGGSQLPLHDTGVDSAPTEPGDDARVPTNDAGEGEAATDAGAPLGPAIVCEPNKYFPVRAAGLKPAQNVDYLAVRRRNGYPGAETDAGTGWTATNFEVLSETGSACASAQDPSCAQQVAHHPADFVQTRCTQVCTEDSVVTTRGDNVQRWLGLDQLKLLLGEIDSADDALLLVSAANYDIVCGDAEQTSVRAVADGYELFATRMTESCAPIQVTRYHLHVSKSGEITTLSSAIIREDRTACVGRKPAGLCSEERDLGKSKLGDYLARCAHLEAASVVSFERLARELTAHAAPPALIDAAIAARADEVRHAELVGRMAREHGGEPVEAQVAALDVRALEEIGIENAVEGCVRETFGALIGHYQAEHVPDGKLRAAMVVIAEDEARHAALAHRVNHWILDRLGSEARARIAQAKQRAVYELAQEITFPVDEDLQRLAGLPPRRVARLLLGELTQTLWADPVDPQEVRSARACA
jgi:hypothetical protein